MRINLLGSLVAIASIPLVTTAAHARTVVFLGRDAPWRLKFSGNRISYEYRQPGYREPWHGENLPVKREGDTIVYIGDLWRSYVIAGEAVDDQMPVRIQITRKPCTDLNGREQAITATVVSARAGENPAIGYLCGKDLPKISGR